MPVSPIPPVNQPSASDDGTSKVHNPLQTMREGEKILCDIRRHPFGIFLLYASVGLFLVLVAVIGYGIMPGILTESTKAQVYSYATTGLVVAGLGGLIAVLVGHIIYWGNHWIVTSDSVTQINQLTLFNTQSSQLSLANVEDVTSEKSGLLPHLLNYGSLKAETAGERQKFKLVYCPNPDYYAKLILKAREDFEEENYRIAALHQATLANNAAQNVQAQQQNIS
jgi:hypothetical protein